MSLRLFRSASRRLVDPLIRVYNTHVPGSYYFFGEFGFECLYSVPYAHHLLTRGLLKQTTGVAGTAPLYFFSPRHTETRDRRSDAESYPPFPIHRPNPSQLDVRRWLPPDYKGHYANSEWVFDRPILVVANKYNSEWGGPPVSFLSLETLRFIFDLLGSRYQIIYNRYTKEDDCSKVYDLGDFGMIRKEYPEVLTLHELHDPARESWNRLQLRIYANCERFISVQGGASALASYFGGINIVYARKGLELSSGEFEQVYPRLSGCRILRVPAEPADLRWEGSPRFQVPAVKRPIDKEFRRLLPALL